MIRNFIIGIILSSITSYILLINFKKIIAFKIGKFISIVLLFILTFIIAASKSLSGNFNIISAIITGVLSPISLCLLIYIVFGKREIEKWYLPKYQHNKWGVLEGNKDFSIKLCVGVIALLIAVISIILFIYLPKKKRVTSLGEEIFGAVFARSLAMLFPVAVILSKNIYEFMFIVVCVMFSAILNTQYFIKRKELKK